MSNNGKEAYYFSHDANAHSDEKMLSLRAEYGWKGYGIFWAIVELMREQSNYMLKYSDNLPQKLALQLHLDSDFVDEFIQDCINYGLFNQDNGNLYSESLLRRMAIKDNKSKQASEAAQKRWEDERKAKEEQEQSERNADAQSSQSGSNARKGKEKKLKEKQNTTKSNDLSTNSNDDTPELKNYHTNTPDKPVEEWNANDLIKYFGYEMWQEYKVPYVPKNWGKDASNAKNLIKKHGAKTIARAIWWLVHTYEKKPKHFGWVFGSINQFLEWRAEKQERKEYQEWLDKEQEKAEEAIDKYEEKYGSDEFVQTSEIIGGQNE